MRTAADSVVINICLYMSSLIQIPLEQGNSHFTAYGNYSHCIQRKIIWHNIPLFIVIRCSLIYTCNTSFRADGCSNIFVLPSTCSSHIIRVSEVPLLNCSPSNKRSEPHQPQFLLCLSDNQQISSAKSGGISSINYYEESEGNYAIIRQ